MENSPTASKADTDRKESRKPKDSKPETIGFLAVKPESAEAAEPKKLPEAGWLESLQKAPEHLGHMLVSVTESEPKPRAEKAGDKPSQPGTGKRVDTLSRAELFSLSETIMIDGSSLRQIYETHLIGERGLRRLIAEHLRGSDLKKALRREIVEREIDFERDPGLRDMADYTAPDEALRGRSKSALDELLERATLGINDSGEEAAFFKARAIYEASQLHQHKKQRRAVDIALAAAIAVLVALVIALYLSRK